MNWWIIGLQAFTIIAVLWVRYSVKTAHGMIIENHKADLQTQIDRMKTEYTEIQTYKIKVITEFLEYFLKILVDKKTQEDLFSDPKKSLDFQLKISNFGVSLFLFASDETIIKYNEWRSQTKENPNDPRGLAYFAEFVIFLRKDIGYSNTKLDEVKFLNLIITDTEEKIRTLIQQ